MADGETNENRAAEGGEVNMLILVNMVEMREGLVKEATTRRGRCSNHPTNKKTSYTE